MKQLSSVKNAQDKPQCLVSSSGTPLLSAYRANTSLQRLKGLFAYPPLQDNQALVLSPCSAVHTIGFGRAIDVVFLCSEGTVLKAGTLRPWSAMICPKASSVIEMAHGTIQRLDLRVGRRLDVAVASADTPSGLTLLSKEGAQ